MSRLTLVGALAFAAATSAVAEPLSIAGEAGVVAGSHLVVFRTDAQGRSTLATISPETGAVLDELGAPEPEFRAAPVLDAWRDTIVVGANGHDPDAPLAAIFRVGSDGALSHLRDLPRPDAEPCLSMSFALEGPEASPHLTMLCQEGGGAVLASEGDWTDVTLSVAFRFALKAETVLGTAAMSKAAPRSALVAIRGLEGLEDWALASLTEGDRVSPIIDGKSQAPVRVIAGDHPRLDQLILTGDPGRDATMGFDAEGQGGWRFLPSQRGDAALLADSWRNWLAIGWAPPGAPLPWTQETAQPMRVSLYDLSGIAPEQSAPIAPVFTLEPAPISRLWLGSGALVLTTPAGVVRRGIETLSLNRP